MIGNGRLKISLKKGPFMQFESVQLLEGFDAFGDHRQTKALSQRNKMVRAIAMLMASIDRSRTNNRSIFN
jgi:hypothetical protein